MIVRGKPGRPIGAPQSHHLTEPDTHHLSSSQASHTSDPDILKAQAAADALRRLILGIDEETDRVRLSAALHEKLDPLKSSLSQPTWGRELKQLLSRLESDASALDE